MRNTILMAVVVLSAAATLPAQMTGRGPGTGMPGMSGGAGTMMGSTGNLTMGAMHLSVAPDGTVLTVERRYDAATKTISEKLVAYTSTGAKAWTYDTSGGAHAFEIAGNLVILSAGRFPGSGVTTRSELVALNLSNGKNAWSLKVDGIATGIEPAKDLVYVLVLKPSVSTTVGVLGSMMSGDRTLVAVSLSGVVLWSQPLGQ